jgi:ferritin-like metal-binding protein YciE
MRVLSIAIGLLFSYPDGRLHSSFYTLVMDAGLIAAAQHVEHYEMAGYGCVRTYAELLGMNNIAKLLQKTLDEETATDEKLTDLARNINVEAEKAA